MSARLPTPLVSPDWLAAHLDEPGLVVVDASWYLPSANRDARAEYQAAHIPGAVFWDIDALSDQSSGLPHMLLRPQALGRAIGALGIGNGDRVVVYDGSRTNLSAPRVWWTLRIAGHQQVAVLDGGFGRWRDAGRPVQSGLVSRAPTTFQVTLRPELVKSLDQVQASASAGAAQILDARSRGRFAGVEPEPRPGLRGGHIPGARNLPYGELVDSTGSLLPPDQLRARYAAAGVDFSRPVITTCGSGVTASALALGLEILGMHQYSVYDGSWAEWGREEGPPVETGEPGPL